MQVYLVGGAVRDELLGLKVEDKDYVVVGATPQEMLQQGFTQVGKDFPVFLHPCSKAEYALARTERKVGQGYTGFTCYAAPDVTLEDDLQRRDLTINAIAKSDDGTYIDPYGGQADLHNRVLRHVSPAFSEDPLRVLRLARFAARFAPQQFRVAPETWQLAQAMVQAEELVNLTGERVWQEVSRALLGPAVDVFARMLDDLGVWPQIIHTDATIEGHWQLLTKLDEPNPSYTSPSDADRSCAGPLSLPSRFALLTRALFGIQQAPMEHVYQALRVPNECAKLSELLRRVSVLLCESPRSVNAYLSVLKAADPIRRPQRWQQTMAALMHSVKVAEPKSKLFSPSVEQVCQLDSIRQAYCDVDAQALIAQGLSGAAIGQALHAARKEAIERVLSAHG